MRKLQILFSLLFFFSLFMAGENTFQIQNLTTKEGLSQNTVRCLKQGGSGFIWIGTLNGLTRYDGSEFVVLLPKYGNSTSLSDNRIKNIFEDTYGYIWIQTNIDDFNCYDPRLERFVDLHSPNTKYSDAYLSPNGDVWLWSNSRGCLNVVHRGDKLVANYFGKDQLGSDVVNFVFEGSDRTVWIGTDKQLFSYQDGALTARIGDSDFHSAIEAGSNLYLFSSANKVAVVDKQTKKQIREVLIPTGSEPWKLNNVALLSSTTILITTKSEPYVFNTESLSVSSASSLFAGQSLKNAFTYFDNKNDLWIYNKSGSIWQFNKSRYSFKELKLIPPSILSFIDLERYSVFHDSRDIIWITTYGNGLFALNQKTGELNHLEYEKTNTSGLRTNFLLSITEDNSGEIWVGTEHAGISKISTTINNNKVFYPEGSATSDGDKVIRLIHEDDQQNIWLGTKNGDLYVYDKYFNKRVKHVIDGGMPYVLAEDTAGNKWLGTKGKGLLIFRRGVYDKFQVYEASQSDNTSISNNNLYAICKDSKGRMWLGTFGSGLLLAEKKGDKLVFRRFPEFREQQNRIRTIFQDKSGLIWVGGNSGVTVFNPEELINDGSRFINFQFDSKNARSLGNNEVKVIYEDRKGRIWLGTSGGGINLIMKEPKLEDTWFKHYTSEDGLINNMVQGIQEDDKENLWISTESGISKFNIRATQFVNYNLSENWEGDLFCESASFKRTNGDILFGSYSGMYIIHPEEMRSLDSSLPVLFTGLKINGNNVSPGDKGSPLKESISVTKRIRLRYDQNSFNIQFAILNFRNSSANSFTYILEGYEDSWNPVTRHNIATYRNVPPGNYTFRVKGRNSYGIWNQEETCLEIRVVPPLWRSPQAFLLYFILFVLIGLIAIRIIMKINKLNTAVKVEQQLTDYKLLFFTNISHEFRTPLTIIRGAIENLDSQENMPEAAKKMLRFLDKSSLRLLRLINQLLEFRQLQNDKMELTLEQTEVVAFFKDISSTFGELAEKKNIGFHFKTNRNEWNMPLDQSKLEKVAYNLLSNAFKFTPENGEITIELIVNEQNGLFMLKVSDSGIGIPKDKQALLFIRFKQINPSETGTGIGLHFVSGLVKVHKGEIRYEDSDKGGACFVVTIPLTAKAYEDSGVIVEEPKKDQEDEKLSSSEGDFLKQTDLHSLKNYKLLVIEDDPEIRDFLHFQLSNYFQVITAHNGLTGLEMSMEEQPDLIVCDVMMPEMDGYEVTNRLKSEFSTCHIPIIMLTALASVENQLQGIESGADSYITKPFSIRYLLTRIVKLIEQREKLQQKFTKEPGLLPMPFYSVDRDNEFMKKVHHIIELNIENPEFSIDSFASTIGMGRTNFFKKVKGLTGYTPNGYLRVIRLKKAAELLSTTNLNVSEVAYKVGLNNPFYFSKCFKEQFGMSPSEFVKKGNEKQK